MRQFFGTVLLCVAALAANARAAADECLRPGPQDLPPLTTPEDLWLKGEGGNVVVSVVFTAPDQPPAVTVQRNTAGPIFERIVRAHLENWRRPCQVPGAAPTVVQRDFEFLQNGRYVQTVGAANPDGSPDAEPKATACLSKPWMKPLYPSDAQRHLRQGTALVSSTFRNAEDEPEVKLIYDGGDPEFGEESIAYARRQRMPCLPKGASPVSFVTNFNFVIEGREVKMRDLPFRDFLEQIPATQTDGLDIDTRGMSCPFNLRMTMYAPHLPNGVLEMDDHDAARAPLIAWLKKVNFDVPAAVAPVLIAKSFKLSVPCTVVKF